MSIIHHAPDIAVVPCLACDELVAHSELLVKDARHFMQSCCLWHPYHFWCYRSAPPESPRLLDTCGACGDAIDHDALEQLLRWRGVTWPRRLHRRTTNWDHPDGRVLTRDDNTPALPPELGLRFVRVVSERYAARRNPQDLIFHNSDESVRVTEDWVGARFEVVHSSCRHADDLAEWLAVPDKTLEWRDVFADWLEENDHAAEAKLVRLDLDIRRQPNSANYTELREVAASLAPSFCRAICAG